MYLTSHLRGWLLTKKKPRKVLVRMWRNQNLCVILERLANSTATMETIMAVLKKLSDDLAILLLDIYPTELKARS